MLPPFIIEQIRRREEQERMRDERPQPRLDLPVPAPRHQSPVTDDPDRGVVIIEVC